MALMARGSEVHVVYLFDQPIELPYRLYYISLYGQQSKRFWDFNAYRRLNDLIKKEKYDIVMANAGDTLKYAALSKILFRWEAPLIFRNANKVSYFINSRLKYLFSKMLLTRVDYVISVSEICKQDFIRTYSFPSDKIDTVQIGVDLVKVGEVPKDLAHIYLRGPVFVNVANMTVEKNHIGLLSIFNKFLTTVPEAQLILIGKGKLESQLKKYVKDCRINDRVHFLGTRQDVLEIMKGSHGLLLSSHIEGLPGVILEAQYCKIPVVAYDVGGISEVVRSGETGWLIRKDDQLGFVQAIVDIVNGDRKFLEDILNTASNQVRREFNNNVIAGRFLNVFLKLLRYQKFRGKN